jgi:hypothetical protein
MASKKNKKEKETVIPFKDKPNNYFVNYKHYIVNNDGSIEIVAGGMYDEEDVSALKFFLGAKKK